MCSSKGGFKQVAFRKLFFSIPFSPHVLLFDGVILSFSISNMAFPRSCSFLQLLVHGVSSVHRNAVVPVEVMLCSFAKWRQWLLFQSGPYPCRKLWSSVLNCLLSKFMA